MSYPTVRRSLETSRDEVMRQRQPRDHDEAHLQFIRQCPCLICQNNIETEAAHVRFSDARAAKDNPGVSAKPSDLFTVPLCSACHRRQHSMGERQFWNNEGIDPIFVSLALWARSGDLEAAERIIQANAKQG